MYRHLSVLLLVFTIFFSFTQAQQPECLDDLCFQAVDNCHATGGRHHECYEWADEVFNCCHHCKTCRKNDTSVTQADTSVTQAQPECLDDLCFQAVDNCHENGGRHHECYEWADEVFNCCHHCKTCRKNDTSVSEKEEVTKKLGECHPKLCTLVFDVCNKVHPNSSSDCMERADEATNCCYSCLDCPPKSSAADEADANLEERDECQEHMCHAVKKACLHSNHHPEECQDISNEAANCCDDCDSCNLSHHKKHHKKHHKVHKVLKRECEPSLCKKTYDVCRSFTHEHKDCWAIADDEYNCCGHCNAC